MKRIPASGYGTVQRDVMKMDISVYSKAVYCLLMTYKGDKNACFPAMNTIKNDLKISKSTVIRSIAELEKVKLIYVQRGKKHNGENQNNVYIPDVLYEDIVIDKGSVCDVPGVVSVRHHVVSEVDHKNNNKEFLNETSFVVNEGPDLFNSGIITSLPVNKPICNKPISNIYIEKKNQKKIQEKKQPTIRQKLVEFWLKEFHPSWSFSATDGKKVNSIISKIQNTLSQRGAYTEDQVLDFFKVFCSKLPAFYKSETLSVLDSKYETIIEKIKEQENGTDQLTYRQRSIAESINFFQNM